MGYKISSLQSFPLIPGIDLYVFILGRNMWNNGWRKNLEDNFNKIAKEFGPTAAIVAGHDGVDLVYELTELAKNNTNLSRVLELEQREGTYLLLLGSHPSEISEKDLMLLVNEEQIKKSFGNMDVFLDELCQFAQTRNEKFLTKFENKNEITKDILDVVDLKPNFFGFGVNINGAIEKFRDWRNRDA